MRHRTRPTSRATRELDGRLDRDHELVVAFDDLEDPEPVQSQQRFRQPDTVAHAGVLSS
jgi:hypothetical protein